MEIIRPDTKFDFMRFRRASYVLSGILIAVALGIITIKGIALGIDFTGGVETQIRFLAPTPIGDVRSAMDDLGLGISVQSFGDSETSEYLVRAPQVDGVEDVDVASQIHDKLNADFGEEAVAIDRTDVVGPKVGQELREKGVLAVVFALIGILIYITIRFEFAYALGAILATVHDVILVIGLFALTAKEFNLPTIAAVLTIIGYSLNDTIVVFDRIRENRQRNRRMPLSDLINKSVNETLSRTLLTSGTTLLTVISLLVLTQVGSVIHDFAFALLAGILVGTYSSIFVAAPLLIIWAERKSAKG